MRTLVAICIFAFLLQTISSQYVGPFGPNALGLNGYGYAANGYYGPQSPSLGPYGLPSAPLGPALFSGPCLSLCEIPSSNGGGFRTTSSSSIIPRGVSVQTDGMLIEGPLFVSGQLPFLGVVALEGPLPVIGQGVVSYGCGDGYIGIVNEVIPEVPAPVYPGPGFPGYGYNGYPRCGCGVY